MDPNLNDFSHYHHRHFSTQPPYLIHTNGLLSPPSTSASPDGGGGNHLLFSPPQMPSPAAAAPSAIPAKKRGRPRKYGTPEQALTARKDSAAAPRTLREGKEKALLQQQQQRRCVGGNSVSGGGDGKRGYLSKKSMTQLSSTGDAGCGFVPHVIAVAAGDDVTQKVMEFTQQSKREICILSASGSISTVSLQQPAMTEGNITYRGRFEIITLSGSYIRTNLGGRTGGLSVCLSSPDGQIIGGGIGGPLMAAGPVQVIIGSFIFDMKKDRSDAITDVVPSKLPPPIPSVAGGPFMAYPGSHAGNSWLED